MCGFLKVDSSVHVACWKCYTFMIIEYLNIQFRVMLICVHAVMKGISQSLGH